MKFTSKVADLFCESKERRLFNTQLESKYERLYRLAYAWSHQSSLAQDLVQETMLKAIEKRKNLSSLEHFDAWLTKIMRNLFLDNMRHKRRWDFAEESEIDLYYNVECSETQLIKSQENNAFYRAMAKLSFEQREAISLSDLQGFSYQEIAEITSTPIGTVMSRLSRGREKLKHLMQSNELQQHNVVPLRRQ